MLVICHRDSTEKYVNTSLAFAVLITQSNTFYSYFYFIYLY